MVGDGASDSRRAIHAGQNANVITRSHAPVGTHIAHELGVLQCRFWFDVGAVGIVARKVTFVVAQVQIVRVYVFAGRNRLTRKTNDLVVASHGLTGFDGAGGDFVARWNQAAHRNVFN